MRFVTIKEEPELKEKAASWFHCKWGIPKEAYLGCMESCLKNETNYNWYLCLEKDKIIAGLGIIGNDFHKRKDLTPNVCAVYTEEKYRGKGIAKRLLNMAVEDMNNKGITSLYLVTDHIGFYEKCGWEFLCFVQEDDSLNMARMYIHR